MPKEIKILLPDSSSEEYFDIHIQSSDNKIIPGYRFEIWDIEKDNPNQLSAVNSLKYKINACANHWIVAKILASENNKIPVLLKQKIN